MPSNPKGYESQKRPYVIEIRDGKYIDKQGNFFDSNGELYANKSEAIHIPLSEYVNRK